MSCATKKQGRLCGEKGCEYCFKRSFASCEKSKHLTEGQGDPFLIARCSNKKLTFVCPTCKHTFETTPGFVSKGYWCPYCSNKKLCDSSECETCYKKSFAPHPKAKHWSDRNKKTARQTFLHSDNKVWFDCDVCLHEFKTTPGIVSGGCFCPYCSNKKLCDSSECETCYKKSFAPHPKAKHWSDRNKKTARQTFLHSDNKVWFDCDVCLHEFKTTPGIVSGGCFCPYCSNKKLCDSSECETCYKKSFAPHPKAKHWSDRNKKTARQIFSSSNKKAWFNCENRHEFQSVLNGVSRGSWCPKCKNKTETAVLEFLEEHFENPKHQFKVSWCKSPKTNRFLPFDFCVSKTIIEVDGRQHYEQVSNWQSPEVTQKNDRYKEEQAIKNGYSVLRVLQKDIWEDRMDWKKLLLENIKDYETPVVVRLWGKDFPSR
nr:putative endonuclease [Marseillevirus futianmevirus]